MTAARRALGIGLAAAATAAIVALSGFRLVVSAGDEALVRLSWRAVGERIEHCRVPTAEELAALPRHMQQAEICEGRLASFQLSASLDGETVIDRELRPAGARQDRPTYVLELLPVTPGPHRLGVTFSVVGESETAPLELATTIDPGPRDVLLITRDESGALVVR